MLAADIKNPSLDKAGITSTSRIGIKRNARKKQKGIQEFCGSYIYS
jgi:hypothetical protein